jgi:hypothetical protein
MPNSFDVPTSDFILQGTYASLAEAAQAQSIISYNAYKELEFYWTDVHLFDTQGLIYGRTSSPTTPSVLHGEIHPDYDIMIKYLVNNIIVIQNHLGRYGIRYRSFYKPPIYPEYLSFLLNLLK